MTLARFKARNHPQQIAGTGRGDPSIDERYTPPALIRRLHRQWRFTVDAAGWHTAPASILIGRYWTMNDDGLKQSWDGERVWCNPPYSNVPAWVEKAWASRAVVVMLLPANRTEQKWWQRLVEPYRDRLRGELATQFVPGRLNFGTLAKPEGARWKSSPPFGCVLLIWGSPRRRAFQRMLPWK